MTEYDTIYNLPEIGMFWDCDKTLNFTAYDSTGAVLQSLWGCTVEWKLYHYEELLDYPIIEKTAVLTTENEFTINLSYTETKIPVGKYVQQIVITDFGGNVFACARGFVHVLI